MTTPVKDQRYLGNTDILSGFPITISETYNQKTFCILEKETNSKQEQAVENSQSQDIHDSTSFVEVQQRYAR